jgi:hypothetical protein
MRPSAKACACAQASKPATPCARARQDMRVRPGRARPGRAGLCWARQHGGAQHAGPAGRAGRALAVALALARQQRKGVAEPRAAPVGPNPNSTGGARQQPGRSEQHPRGFSGVKVLRSPRELYSVRGGLDLSTGGIGQYAFEQPPDGGKPAAAARMSEPRERVPELVCGLGTEDGSAEDCLLQMVGSMAVRVDLTSGSATDETRIRPTGVVEQGVFELHGSADQISSWKPVSSHVLKERGFQQRATSPSGAPSSGLTGLAGAGGETWAASAKPPPTVMRAAEIRAADPVRWPSSVLSGPMTMTRERSSVRHREQVVSAPGLQREKVQSLGLLNPKLPTGAGFADASTFGRQDAAAVEMARGISSAGGGGGQVAGRRNGSLRGRAVADGRGGRHVKEGMAGALAMSASSGSASFSLARRCQALETRI